MARQIYIGIIIAALVLAFGVILLGAYTRLNDAGLGCPDWPGCYGHLLVRADHQALKQAESAYPNYPLQSTKAWTEMVHRYFAGTLGTLLFIIGAWTWYQRRRLPNSATMVASILMGFVVFQAVLGMWTVTWRLLPLVVMGHLLGGMVLFALLGVLLCAVKRFSVHAHSKLAPWVFGGLIILMIQIILGGWTSANYAAVVCPDFPFCRGTLFPQMDLSRAFNVLSPIGPNYQGGVLSDSARVAIHMMHRYWAFVTASYLLGLAISMLVFRSSTEMKWFGCAVAGLVVIQFTLGYLNVVALLRPIYIPVAHNGVAALLLFTLSVLAYSLYKRPQGSHHV